MSHTISVEQAAARLSDLIGELNPGDEIVLTRHDQPVARILPNHAARSRRKAGSCKGLLVVKKEDDEHLSHFA
jgi:antitoxin (DNA-binding transcriptional repressor) of toxin-antitoxin stability system